LALALLAVGATCAGCSDSGNEHASVEEAFERLDEKPVETAVAEVDGRRISRAEFAAYWREYAQESGVEKSSEQSSEKSSEPSTPDVAIRDAALDGLIERELLVAEALKRGYSARPTLQLDRKRAMVRQLLVDEVEKPVQPESLSEEAVEKAVEAVRARVGHPPGLRASHLLVSVPPEKQKSATEEEVARWFEEAKMWLGVMRDDLSDSPAVHELFEVRDRYREKIPEPLQIHVNAHLVFPIGEFIEEGARTPARYGRALPESWRPVVAEFGKAATEMARERRFGALSDPVKTQFGWHLILPEELYPAKVGDTEQIRALATQRVLRRKRNERLVERVTDWMAAAEVQTFPQVIARAEETKN
jgi:hypothetical protein